MSVCDGMIKIPLPRYLDEHKEEILHIFDNTSGGSDYNPKGWRDHLNHDPVVAADLDIIMQTCPNTISRMNVRHFAQQSRSGRYKDLRRLFLACMIWGWGKDYKDKRGRKSTEAALSDTRLREILKKSVKRIKNAKIQEAYEGFTLNGCGSAFFTKFFFFIGQEWGVKPLPLILDSRVKNFLRRLSEEEGQEVWGKFSFKKAEEYLQYICSMDDWATKLALPTAENIEYFMYKEERKIKKNTKGGAGKSRNNEEHRKNEKQEGGGMDHDEILGVSFSKDKIEQLNNIARNEFGTDSATLARFWIIERLHQYIGQYSTASLTQSVYEVRGLTSAKNLQNVNGQGENRHLRPFSSDISSEPVEEIIIGAKARPHDKDNTKSWEIGGIPKKVCQLIIGQSGPLDVSTVVKRFGAEWNDKNTVLVIPIRLSIRSEEYKAFLHYREKTQKFWIGSPLNGGAKKLAQELANANIKAGPVSLKFTGNKVQVM